MVLMLSSPASRSGSNNMNQENRCDTRRTKTGISDRQDPAKMRVRRSSRSVRPALADNLAQRSFRRADSGPPHTFTGVGLTSDESLRIICTEVHVSPFHVCCVVVLVVRPFG